MSIRNQEQPEFAQALRGYDRLQVDEYVARLHEYAVELEDRALSAEQALGPVQHEHEELRHRLAISGGGDLPTRLAQILDLAKEEAEAIRSNARREADELCQRAREEAQRAMGDIKSRREAAEQQVRELEHARDELIARLNTLGREVGATVERHRSQNASTAQTQRIAGDGNGNGNGQGNVPKRRARAAS